MTGRLSSLSRRALAGVAAIALLMATFLAGWHHASVTHGRCLEHGEEVHLARVGELSALGSGDAAGIHASPWAAVDGDEHCEILASAHQPADTDAALAITVAHVAIDPVTLPPPSITEIGFARYRLAPKTSPPAAS